MTHMVGYVKNISAGTLVFGATSILAGTKQYVLLKDDFFSNNAGYLLEQFTRGNVEIYDTDNVLISNCHSAINCTANAYGRIKNNGMPEELPAVYVSSNVILSGYESYVKADSTSGTFTITLPLLSSIITKQPIEIKNQAGTNYINIVASGSDKIDDAYSITILAGTSVILKPDSVWLNTSSSSSGQEDKTQGTQKFSFTSGNLSNGVLTVSHNLNTLTPSPTLYDGNNKVVIPNDFYGNGLASFSVNLKGFTVSGTWTLLLINSGSSPVSESTISVTMDGGSSDLVPGVISNAVIPYNYTITGWNIIGDVAGSAVIDIWSTNGIPTVANSICASAKPTLSNQQVASSSTLTGWTTNLVADNQIKINIDSVSTIKRLTLTLKVRRA